MNNTIKKEWSFYFMPKVSQSHLDARRQQIIDAARTRFASHGFARTSMPDLGKASGLSIGAIYRYFASKDEIVTAICEEAGQAFPTELTTPAVHEFLEHIRTMARDKDHALVRQQLTALRDSIAALLPDRRPADVARIAEAFAALGLGYSQQLAVRGDLDTTPFATALMAIIDQ